MADFKGPIFTISELATELGITTRTIRYYEEVGLIAPHRFEGIGQRLYTARERARLKLILRGKKFRFSLAEIREMIDLYDVDPTEKEQLTTVIQYGERRLRETEELLAELNAMRSELLEYTIKFQARLEEIKER